MRSTTKVILNQLENEGVKHEQLWHLHWFTFDNSQDVNFPDLKNELGEAVDYTLSYAIRITALLSKLRDSLDDDEGELGDLLVESDEESE